MKKLPYLLLLLLLIPVVNAASLVSVSSDIKSIEALKAPEVTLNEIGLLMKTEDTFFTKLISARAELTYGEMIYEFNNPYSVPFDALMLQNYYEDAVGIDVLRTESFILTNVSRIEPVYAEVYVNKTCVAVSNVSNISVKEPLLEKEILPEIIPEKEITYECGSYEQVFKENKTVTSQEWTQLKEILPGISTIKIIPYWLPALGKRAVDLKPALIIPKSYTDYQIKNWEYKAEKWSWLNTSYDKRIPINCSGMSAGTPLVINGSAGFNLGSGSQIVWTNCQNNLSLYYVSTNTTNWAIANDTAQVAWDTELGNVSSYGNVFSNNYKVVYHFGQNDNATYIKDSSANNNSGTARAGVGTIPVSTTGLIGKGMYFTGGADGADRGGIKASLVNSIDTTNNFYQQGVFRLNGTQTHVYVMVSNYHTPGVEGGWNSRFLASGRLGMFATTSDGYLNYDAPANASLYNQSFYYYAVSKIGTNISLFINGNYYNSGNITGNIIATDDALKIGYSGINYYYFTGVMDEVRVFNGTFNQTIFSQEYNNTQSLVGFGSLGAPENSYFTFVSQAPSDINATNAFGGVAVVYNISTAGLNLSSLKLLHKISNGSDECKIIINGSAYCGYSSEGVTTTNASNSYTFTLSDNQALPGIYNINESVMRATAHNAYALTGNNAWVKIATNDTNATIFKFGEIMANTSGSNPLQVYYCNSTYSSGNPQSNANCAAIYSIGATSGYNHTHGSNSAHNLFTATLNITSGKIGAVKISNPGYYLFYVGTPLTTWNLYYANITTNANTTQTSGNNGNSWTSQAYSFDFHLHAFMPTDKLYYLVNVYDNASVEINSSVVTDNLDTTLLPPSAPGISTPVSVYYANWVFINYSASLSPNNASISAYNLSLLNNDYSLNATINASSTALTYNYSTGALSVGTYYIRVEAKDANNLTSAAYSLPFYVNNKNLTFAVFDFIYGGALTNWSVNLSNGTNTTAYYSNYSTNESENYDNSGGASAGGTITTLGTILHPGYFSKLGVQISSSYEVTFSIYRNDVLIYSKKEVANNPNYANIVLNESLFFYTGDNFTISVSGGVNKYQKDNESYNGTNFMFTNQPVAAGTETTAFTYKKIIPQNLTVNRVDAPYGNLTIIYYKTGYASATFNLDNFYDINDTGAYLPVYIGTTPFTVSIPASNWRTLSIPINITSNMNYYNGTQLTYTYATSQGDTGLICSLCLNYTGNLALTKYAANTSIVVTGANAFYNYSNTSVSNIYYAVYNISLVDENTNTPFNISSVTSATLKSYCTNSTITYDLKAANVTNIPAFNVMCDLLYLRTDVTYPSGTYYRNNYPLQNATNFTIYLANLNANTLVEQIISITDYASAYYLGHIIIRRIVGANTVDITSQALSGAYLASTYLTINQVYKVYINTASGASELYLGDITAAATTTSFIIGASVSGDTFASLTAYNLSKNIHTAISWNNSTRILYAEINDSNNFTTAIKITLQNLTITGTAVESYNTTDKYLNHSWNLSNRTGVYQVLLTGTIYTIGYSPHDYLLNSNIYTLFNNTPLSEANYAFLAFIIVGTLALLGFTISIPIGIVFTIVSIAFTSLFGILQVGAGAIVGLIIVGVIIIFVTSKRTN
jgi:hypothetical protein